MNKQYAYIIVYTHFEDEDFCPRIQIQIISPSNIEQFKEYCTLSHIAIDKIETIYTDHKIKETYHD